MEYYKLGVAASAEFFGAEVDEYHRNEWALYEDGFLSLYWMGGPLDAPVP